MWELLTDIDNWAKVASIYEEAHWQGRPWVPGSCVEGSLKQPLQVSFRYVLERCDPPLQISYLAHSVEVGFATHRIIELRDTEIGTAINISSYVVGKDEGQGFVFLKRLTEEWFDGFAKFCDHQSVARRTASASMA